MINKSKFNLKSVKVEDILTMPPPVVKNFLGSDLGQSYLSSLSPLEYNKLLASYGKNQLAPLTAPSGGAPSGGGTATAAPSGRQQQGRASAGPSATPAGPAGPSVRPSTQVKPSEDARFEWERQLEALAGKKPQQPSQQQQRFQTQEQTTNLSPSDMTRRIILDTARERGWSKEGTAALLGMTRQESNFNPYTIGDGGRSFSIFQVANNFGSKGKESRLDRFVSIAKQKTGLDDPLQYIKDVKSGKIKADPKITRALIQSSIEHFVDNDIDSKINNQNVQKALGSNNVAEATEYLLRATRPKNWNEQGKAGWEWSKRLRNTQNELPGVTKEYEQQIREGLSPGVSPEDAARTGSAGYGQGPMRAGQTERRPGQAAGEEDLYSIAQSKRTDVNFRGFKRSNDNCGRGTGAVVDAIFGTNHTKGGIGANAGAFAGRNPKPFIPQLYSGPSGLPEGYMNDPSQWRIGDVVAAQGGNGHIQVWNGKQWVSDFKQKGILPGYSGYTLHRVKPEAYSQVSSEYAKNMDQGGNTRNYLKQLGIDFGTAPVVGVERPEESNRKIVKPPEGYENLPEDIRKAIEGLPESRRNAVYENLQAIKDRGDDFVSTFTQTYREAIDSNENPQNAAQQIAETASVSPNAAGSIAPGAAPIVNEQGYSMPVTGKMMHEGHGRTSEFGYGRGELHAGVDIYSTDPETGKLRVGNEAPVNAPMNGTITRISPYQPKAGNIIVMKDDKGIEHKFLHVGPPSINPQTGKPWKTNDRVTQGQVLTTITGSGTQFGAKVAELNGDIAAAVRHFDEKGWGSVNKPHLHYETRINGKLVNPSVIFNEMEAKTGSDPKKSKMLFSNEVDKLKYQLKQGQITQQEYDMQIEKITSVLPTQQTAPQTQVPVSPGTDQGAAAATGSAGFVAAPAPATPAATPSAPAPATPAATPSAPAPATPAATPSAPAPATPAATPSAPAPATPAATPSAPAPATHEKPTAEPTTEKPPPTYEDGGEQQFAGENLALVNRNTNEVEALLNDTEKIQVTPGRRNNDVGIEDRTQQLLAQEQATANQQSNALKTPEQENMATNYMSDPYNEDWQEMMQEVKSASAQIFKNAAAQRAYNHHKFEGSGDAFGHFGFKTTTVRGLA